MDIECQGCYYTLCSFVCLTEDLSEILQFLWRHGCLRRSYSCEKCGRKCAIGDKDLFFRCNRNTLDSPVSSKQFQNLSMQSNSQFNAQQTPSSVQGNEKDEIIVHQLEQINQNQFIISSLNTSDISQPNKTITNSATNSENLLMLTNETCQNDSVNLTFVPTSSLSTNDLTQSSKVLTVIDSHKTQIIHSGEESRSILSTTENCHANVISLIQSDLNASKSLNSCTLSRQNVNYEPPLKTLKKSGKSDGRIQKKRCNFKVSMKKGTFFEKSKLPIDTVCKFVVFWCCMKHPTQEFLRNELSLATRTVVDWSTACREICIHWAKSVSEKIGGDGIMVQVDEVKIQENKDSKNSDNINKFSFWGMEKDKEKGKIFIVPVPACDSWSLLTVINDWVLPGSVIISNCWKAYDCLKLPEFIQQTSVQSKTFVHPQNNAGQQNFDGKIDDLGPNCGGELHMPRFGTRRSHHLGDLAEFMFKRRYSNHLERMHAFFKQISMAYPLH